MFQKDKEKGEIPSRWELQTIQVWEDSPLCGIVTKT